jgi:hypothetical protein
MHVFTRGLSFVFSCFLFRFFFDLFLFFLFFLSSILPLPLLALPLLIAPTRGFPAEGRSGRSQIVGGFPPSAPDRTMDVLPLDDRGFVPLMEFRTVSKDEWIGFNSHLAVIPAEAKDYRLQRPNDRRATGPTGAFLDMEWGLDMDWYNHDASWRPYIPLKPLAPDGKAVSESGSDWFFNFDLSTPWESSATGHFIVPDPWLAAIETDLSSLFSCIKDIASNHPFPSDSARPLNWDHGLLFSPFPTVEELQVAGGIAKRTAIDYMGFLNWWTASISGWDANLDVDTTEFIKMLDLHRFRKRGVLVDWEKDWREINIPNLIQHRVPIAYLWSTSLAANPRFTALSPRLLCAYNESRLEVGYELHSEDLPELQDELSVAKKYDYFLQDVSGNGRPDPDVEFSEDWCYYVVDFQGWSRRRVPLRVVREYYVLFGSAVSHEDGLTLVHFRRWETLGNPAALTRPRVALEDDPQGCMVRGADEIRELHKYNHAPAGTWYYDMDGRPTSSTDVPTLPSRSCTRPSISSPQDGTLIMSSRWLCQMTGASGQSSSIEVESAQRSSSRSSGSHNSQHRSRPGSRMSAEGRARGQSASPRPQPYNNRRTESPAAIRADAVRRLQDEGSVITFDGIVWGMPPELTWNQAFLMESILLLPDARTLTRLKYWAVCKLSMRTMRHILNLAIERNMKFHMATKMVDLKAFRPASAPVLSELTRRTYEAGFQEEHLTDINGGAAFRDQYMGKLADILRRPHARALVSMGGPTAWITKRFGGSEIVQHFLNGPSAQVTIHHRGAVSSSPFYDEPIFYDQISAQEENLIHGYVPAENPEHHHWLFPTMDIMEDFCNHWCREWTQGCDLIFHNIVKALERGTAKPLTRKGWRSYLHSTNHGDKPLVATTFFSIA